MVRIKRPHKHAWEPKQRTTKRRTGAYDREEDDDDEEDNNGGKEEEEEMTHEFEGERRKSGEKEKSSTC